MECTSPKQGYRLRKWQAICIIVYIEKDYETINNSSPPNKAGNPFSQVPTPIKLVEDWTTMLVDLSKDNDGSDLKST